MPSREEVERIKCEISDLEGELERVQQLAIQLATSLRERKEWIAPIKMLPSDLLSNIFIISSNERNFAPVRIAAVCHRWREVVLATPLAWSSIDTWYKHPVGYLEMFMERSSPCLLHLALSQVDRNGRLWSDVNRIVDLHDDNYILYKNSHRLKCVTSPTIPSDFFKTSFSNLTDLQCRLETVALQQLERSKFPNLRYLEIKAVSSLSPRELVPLVNTLQFLRLNLDDQGAWMTLVKSNSSTLQTVQLFADISIFGMQPIEPETLEMQSLQFLRVYFRTTNGIARWPLVLVAPRLLSYKETVPAGITIIHNSIKSVTHLLTNRIPSLVDYPNLRVLLIYPLQLAEEMVDRIVRSSTLVPQLEMIESLLQSENGQPPLVPHTKLVRRQGIPDSAFQLKQSYPYFETESQFPSPRAEVIVHASWVL
jgi:hypothetical protein